MKANAGKEGKNNGTRAAGLWKNKLAALWLALAFVCIPFACFNAATAAETWTQKADFGGTARYRAVGFSIGGKGYIGLGYDGVYKRDFWEYNPNTNAWSQKADFGGTARDSAVGFSIGSRGYIGAGGNKDFWEYDPEGNTWSRKADYGGAGLNFPVAFSIGSKGYIGTGSDGTYKKDFWEYDPATDVWTQKADFGGTARHSAVGFSIGARGYIGTGFDGSRYKDFWEYEPVSNTWMRKADFGGTARSGSVGFSIGTKGYIGTGYDDTAGDKNDFWEYDPDSDIWTRRADFGGTVRVGPFGFAIGTKGYIGTGYGWAYRKDVWEYSISTAADTYPDPFTFTDQTGVALSTECTSNAIMVSGIDTTTTIFILGGTYVINGGSYTNELGTVTSGDTVTVKLTSSENYSTRTDASLTIGGVSDTFSVTTLDDTIPNPFTFTDETGVPLNTVVTSNAITVSGITAAVPISITGGTYSINGGAYTSGVATVSNGNTVVVRVTSSVNYSTTTNATLTIGEVSDTFSVTTHANTEPDPFTFTDQTGVPLSTVVTSNAITVSGIDTEVGISITGGTYSINGGAYTSNVGNVSNGDTVTVRLMSSASCSTTTDATLIIGGVSDTFSVTTTALEAWTQKADFGGSGRSGAVGFSIGTKGYIGTGYDGSYKNDFWEYDPAANAWTQKADFGGSGRSGAVGFSIGTKGYIGTGSFEYVVCDSTIDKCLRHHNSFSDFWEYDPAANTWTRKADFGGGGRLGAVGFSIATKGYIGTGAVGETFWDDVYMQFVVLYNSYADFWEYDPAANTWTQKADFGGMARYRAVGFSIGTKAYVGTGLFMKKSEVPVPPGWVFEYQSYRDLGEYDPATNTWTQKADFGGTARDSAVGFSIGTRGYIGTGSGTKDFWEYDPAANTWMQRADFGGSGRSGAVGFTIGTRGYIGTGSGTKDFWEYSIATAAGIYPDPFTFTDQTGVALSTECTSNAITVSGINTAMPISITGGKYSVNGGGYTSADGTVSNGNTVTVRLMSSANHGTTTNATLTIGGLFDNFSVRTLDDTVPDPFTFTDQTGVPLSSEVMSNAITISGITAAVPISITGGTYSINGGAYTSGAATVSNGNIVVVRVISSGNYSTTTNATLTIGGVSDTFSVTTLLDVIPRIQVTPGSLNFGYVPVGSTKDLALTVKNTGVGVLTGSATTSAPFKIVSIGSYSLVAGQSQVITIRYKPTSPGTHAGAVVFTGGGGATIPVTGKTEKYGSLPWLMLLLGD